LGEISGERLAADHKVKNKGCFNCTLACSRYYVVGEHEAEGPEFETLCGFTSRIGSSDLGFALEINRYLNQVGMDSLSTCEVIGWLMECQQRGLLSPDDVDGLSISWGDTDTVRQLVQMIARREGIGDALADGATRFASRFGEQARELVMQVKGLDLICGDPRGIKAYGLTYAVASRGGDHLRAEPYFELTERHDEARERFGTPAAADRLAEEGKAALVTWSERLALLTDCLTMCKNVGLCMDVLDFESAAGLLRSGTGVDYTAEELEQAMADSVERDRELNRSFGVSEADDTLPRRFVEEPLTAGPSAGSTVDIDRMVREYHALKGRRRRR
ncbi:MAG: aldehyde ferredoxin oxidoreductase C-terminal domain-containing protein, partial [Deltaproteobacteria bacterium]|nr:aldehyde ferredoxin oxidoreductase C-terminal domain-containing protein [Deltaproteobacteria bacterium]